MDIPFKRVLVPLAILGVAVGLMLPSWGQAEASGTCSGDEECFPALWACEDACDTLGPPNSPAVLQCKRACFQQYVQCAIWACID